MNIENLKYGIKNDFRKPITKEMADILRTFINGNLKTNHEFILEFQDAAFSYFTNLSNLYKKFDLRKEHSSFNNFLETVENENLIAIDYGDDFFNFAVQIMKYETKESLILRIVLLGVDIKHEEFRTSEYAYYLKCENGTIELFSNDNYKILGDIKIELSTAEEGLLESDMIEDYPFQLLTNQMNDIHKILRVTAPYISFNGRENEETIRSYLSRIKMFHDYPIFKNKKAEQFVQISSYAPEDIIEAGFDPKQETMEKCFGIDINQYLRLEDIKILKEWNDLIQNENLSTLLEYYKENHNIQIELSEIRLFMKIYHKTNTKLEDLIKYVIRSVIENEANLKRTLSDVYELHSEGYISSFKGKYDEKIKRKKKFREVSKISQSIMDEIESLPTLDHIYKILCAQ